MDPLIWASLLMLLAIALVVAEIFTPPPYGAIGLLAVTAAAASIWMAFHKGAAAGFCFAAIAMIGLPTTLALAVKYWPNTSLGRRVLLEPPTSDQILPEDDPRHHLQQLIGKPGRANTLMVPGGTVAVEGRTYEAVSEGMPIEAGDSIQVVQVRHNRLVVRRTDSPPPPQNPEDVLTQPIDALGLDSFEDPLA